MYLRKLLIGIITLFACSNAMALRDDVLIIVNDNSVDSPQLGTYYAQQRDIDPANIVHVRVPAGYFIGWDDFRRLRDQLIDFMQRNTLDDPTLTPAVCVDGEPPYYCPAAVEQLRAHSRIRYLVTTRGVPTRMVVDGSTLFDATAPTSVDNYLKYWLLNYFTEDTRLTFNEREVAFGDGRGMRTVLPATDRELIIGRLDGLTLGSARALLDRTLAAERGGLSGRLFGSTRFNRWVDNSTGRLIYPSTGITGWPYQLGLFDEARPECVDYLNVSGLLPAGKTPAHCTVQLNEDSDPVTSASYPAPGNAASRQPQAVNALLYQGWLDGQAAVGSFDALLNWRKNDQCTVTECRDAADPAACQAASTDVFGELNTDCVGMADGFMGYNHQSWPVSYLAVWPTGWFQSTGNSSWNDGGHGDVNQLALPEVRTDTGFDDSFSLWFRNTDQVAAPRCFPASDFSAPPGLPCADQRRIVLAQRIPAGRADPGHRQPPDLPDRPALPGGRSCIATPVTLQVRFFVREAGGAQVDYGTRELATLAPGNTGWTPAEVAFPLDPALHAAASYDGIKFRIETTGVFAGALGIDAVSVQQVGAGAELALNGSFSEGHRQVAAGDHAATFLDRLGGVAFWGSVSHHQSAGCAFCLSGMAPLVYFTRGLPLGDAVWFAAANNSGILYGDPLYSPVAVRLNPVNATDTLSGVVALSGSTVNGRDPARVSTGYRIDVCPGEDFLVCDRQGSWQPTGLSGAGGAENMLLGDWDSTSVAPGSYTLRLAVTSQNTLTGRSQTLHDFYPVRVGDAVPPPGPGSVQFSAAGYSVAENGASVLVMVLRTGGSTGAITVDYASSDGTATAGSDYGAVGGRLLFTDGVISQSFSVPIVDYSVPEADESFTLTLSNATAGASLGAVSTATVTIIDDDPLPAGSVQFSTGTYSVAENGASVLVTVTRTGGSAGAVSVDYATGNGTALAGSDYSTRSGTLIFADGVTASQTFSVPILNDAVPESDESFTLGLSNVTGGASLGAVTTATVTITDDDPVAGMDNAPVLANNGVNGLVLAEGGALSIDFSATDADPGDTLTFSTSASNLGSADFTGNSLSFTGSSAGTGDGLPSR